MPPPWLERLGECVSQLFNIFIPPYNDSWGDEMFCSRAWRNNWKIVSFLDFVFGKDHCKECYEWEKDHYDSPRFN